eukprot:scaffold216023_cov31-Attheya_sp.AAC.1
MALTMPRVGSLSGRSTRSNGLSRSHKSSNSEGMAIVAFLLDQECRWEEVLHLIFFAWKFNSGPWAAQITHGFPLRVSKPFVVSWKRSG